jgi:type IV fimbrial biogenesis protein FimT
MRRNPRQPGGFTLIELMLVMLIITVVLGMAAPSLRGWRRGTTMKGAAEDFITITRYARVQAVANGAVHRVILEPATGRYYVAVQSGQQFEPLESNLASGTIPDGFRAQWADQQSAQRGYVEFQPNGRAQTARLRITSDYGDEVQVECATPSEVFRIVDPTEVR